MDDTATDLPEVLYMLLHARARDAASARPVLGDRDAIAGIVLDLGCGLDTRARRCAPPPGVDWYDVDLPQVIALRERLLPGAGGLGCRSAAGR